MAVVAELLRFVTCHAIACFSLGLDSMCKFEIEIMNRLAGKRFGFIRAERAGGDHARFLLRRDLREIRSVMALCAPVFVVARLAFVVVRIQARETAVVFPEISLRVRFREEPCDIFMA